MNCGACLCAAAAAATAMEGMEEGPGPGSDGVEGHIRGDRGMWRAIVVVGFVDNSWGEGEEEWFVVCGLEWKEGWWRGGGDVRRDPCRHPAASARLRRLGYLILGKQCSRTTYGL